MKQVGICKLTGGSGAFVASHLLPKALTRPKKRGNSFIEAGYDCRPVHRFSSWYDSALVTRDGENILRDYDDAGIKELRRLRLVWSSWCGADTYNGSDLTLFGEALPGQGIRSIPDTAPVVLRLFFLSLLWRAAATDLKEFSEVQMPVSDLEVLRQMVLDGSVGNPDFYPVTLTQIVTRGPIHNFAPLALDTTHDVGHGETHRINVFRFYFDGLIVYVHRPEPGLKVADVGDLAVGHSSRLGVQCIPAENSFQIGNLLQGSDETHLQWPKKMARLSPNEFMEYDSRLARYEAIFGSNHPWIVRRE